MPCSLIAASGGLQEGRTAHAFLPRALIAGIDPYLGAVAATIAAGILIHYVGRQHGVRPDAAIGIVSTAIAGLCWLGWGAVVGLPLMAGADVAWYLTRRRRRRWRR